MKISAFDLDHTLVGSNSGLLFYRHLINRGFFHSSSIVRSLVYSIRHYFFDLSLPELHKKVFERFLKGSLFSLVQEEVSQFLKKDFYRHLYPPTLARLRLAQHQGDHTVILSNGPSFLVGPIAEYLGVSEWNSSRYSVDGKGEFNAIESILLGEGKASYIQKLTENLKIDLRKVTVYSDSILDLPLLSIAGKAVVVNPNFKMKKILSKKTVGDHMKIGFFGGSFDPIHLGHINLAIQIFEQKGLDKILFCPTRISPMKQDAPPIEGPEHRWNMLHLSLAGLPFEPLDAELVRPPPSFTIDTLKDIQAEELFLILAEDAAYGLDQWKDVEELLTLAPPLIGTRFGFDPEKLNRLPQNIKLKVSAGMCQIQAMDISSTTIRERLEKRLYCGHLLSEKVIDYILDNDLYYNQIN